jgi:hypothetical protein
MSYWLVHNLYLPREGEVLPEWMNFWWLDTGVRKLPTISHSADPSVTAKSHLDNPHELVLDESSFTIINDREFMMVDHGTGDVYRFKWYPQDRWYEGAV